ncbi:uncharacterized protein [Haliotis asinina]|uniref:uncharacterized protein n=1 Tax=Haliotis asinina TaxID=109174 RepID=UPI003531B7FE
MANVENQVEQVVFKTEKTNQEVNPSTLHSVHSVMPVPYEKETCVKRDEPSLPPNFPNIATKPFQSAPVHPSSGDTSLGPQTYGPPSFPHGQSPPMIPNMTELLISSSYGIPRPTLPLFNNEKEKDFAILKMDLDTLVNVHTHLTEQYKYQLLLDRLGGRAKRLAEAYIYAPQPYSEAFEALKNKYGQPRQLVQGELGAISSMPFVTFGDNEAFENFALAVHSLVGMLKSLDGESCAELQCGSHVDKLLSKLPVSLRDSFIEHCIKTGVIGEHSSQTYTLSQFSYWLQIKSLSGQVTSSYHNDDNRSGSGNKPLNIGRFRRVPPRRNEPTMMTSFHTRSDSRNPSTRAPTSSTVSTDETKMMTNFRAYCPYCSSSEHYLNSCKEFEKLSLDEIVRWMKEGNRCSKCARTHKPVDCTLRKVCHTCQELHLTVLHDAVKAQTNKVYSVMTEKPAVYVDQPSKPCSVMLKVVKVVLHGPGGQMETYAVLDDGSQRTMILTSTAERPKLCGRTDEILLSTIWHESYRCTGKSVNLSISPGDSPQIQYPISNAFTSPSLCLSEYTYPVKDLQIRWPHLRDYPLPSIYNAQPVILIGSDYADLILPQEPVHFGPKGAPVAVHTRLGWSLQGQADMHLPRMSQTVEQCLLTSSVHRDPELWSNVEKLWQIDAVPNGTKDVTRSKQDKQALETLETFTERVEMYEVVRYATPLLRIKNGVSLNATEESVKHNLIRTERRLQSNPELAHVHKEEIQKLVDAGYVKIISPEEAGKSAESWYIPHHIVQHNGKNRLVFNCSYSYEGRTLNENLLPGPQLGSSLIGVLLRFRQHRVAISGDIKAIFHQVRLLPKDRPLLRFIWRDMDQTVPPNIYE